MVTPVEVLKGYFNAGKAMGAKAVKSDAMLVIDGFENLSMLIKSFPWPVVAPNGAVTYAGPLGTEDAQPAQIKILHSGPIVMMETVTAQVQQFLLSVIKNGGQWNATAYEGSPDRFFRALPIKDCFFEAEDFDRDWEQRGTICEIAGTLTFKYFGEVLPGNMV